MPNLPWLYFGSNFVDNVYVHLWRMVLWKIPFEMFWPLTQLDQGFYVVNSPCYTTYVNTKYGLIQKLLIEDDPKCFNAESLQIFNAI